MGQTQTRKSSGKIPGESLTHFQDHIIDRRSGRKKTAPGGCLKSVIGKKVLNLCKGSLRVAP